MLVRNNYDNRQRGWSLGWTEALNQSVLLFHLLDQTNVLLLRSLGIHSLLGIPGIPLCGPSVIDKMKILHHPLRPSWSYLISDMPGLSMELSPQVACLYRAYTSFSSSLVRVFCTWKIFLSSNWVRDKVYPKLLPCSSWYQQQFRSLVVTLPEVRIDTQRGE